MKSRPDFPQPRRLDFDKEPDFRHITPRSRYEGIYWLVSEALTPAQQLLSDIITTHGEITLNELSNRYQEQASFSKSNRMVRTYLTKLCYDNLVVADGQNRGRTYRPKLSIR